MKHMTFTLKASLLGKLLLAAAMMIGGESSVWGDELVVTSTTSKTYTSNTPIAGNLLGTTEIKCEYIIPSSKLTELQEKQITDMSFTLDAATTGWGDAEFKVFLKEVTASGFPSPVVLQGSDGATIVYEGTLDATKTSIDIAFTTPFIYSNEGKNLLVGVYCTKTGTAADVYFKLIRENSSDYTYYAGFTNNTSGSLTRTNWYPETKFTFETPSAGGISAPTNFEASGIEWNSATMSWTQGGDVDEWQVYVSTTNEEPEDSNPSITNVTTKPYDLEGLSGETTYYAFVRAYKDAEDVSDWVSTDFTTPKRYPIPAEFSCSAVTGTTATLEWADGYGATPSSWQIKYSTIQGFDPASSGELVNNVGSRSITLTELTESITYYARVRAVYADGNSNWSSQIEFTPHSEESITVNNATITNSKAPIDGNSVKSSCIRSQFIIPSANLSEVNGRQITKLTFYTKATDSNYETWDLGGAKFEVYLKDVGTQTNFSSTTMDDWGVNVYNSGTLSISDYTMEIILDTPFNYTGGNLKIGIKQTEKGAIAKYWVWYGAGGTANSMRYSTDSNAATRDAFNPKVTITSIPVTTAPVKLDDNGYTTFASPWALDLTSMPSGLTAYRAKVFEEESKVRFYSDINQEVAANTGVLLAGTPGETYMIPVAASGTTLADNDFLVNEAGGTFEAGDYTYYGMLKNSTPLAFGEFNPETVAIPSNKAYVKVTKAAAAKGFSFVFEDTATAIRTLSEAQPAAGKEVFDLSGRKVMNSSLKKGLYIIGGKKMLVK